MCIHYILLYSFVCSLLAPVSNAHKTSLLHVFYKKCLRCSYALERGRTLELSFSLRRQGKKLPKHLYAADNEISNDRIPLQKTNVKLWRLRGAVARPPSLQSSQHSHHGFLTHPLPPPPTRPTSTTSSPSTPCQQFPFAQKRG